MKLLDMSSGRIRRNSHVLKTHPRFSEEAHHRFGRMHLPVARSIQCKYCGRKYDCANESRPGITSGVLTPHEALERVRAVVDRNDNLGVIGIADPGVQLAEAHGIPGKNRDMGLRLFNARIGEEYCETVN